ncbi:hypothetical protein Q5752_000431 [Cryptotrichosporon argae]
MADFPPAATSLASSSSPADPSSLPPEALALASQLFDFARQGFTDFLSPYLTRGISPDLTNANGDTLLMLAAYHNRLSTVRMLVAAGADVNAVNGKGQSILAGAVFKGWADVVRTLVEAGADPRAGQPSPVDCAVMFKRPDLLAILEKGGEGAGSGAQEANVHGGGRGEGEGAAQ